MRKFGVFTSFLFLSILIAGSYGILHDQITYTISPEYFTKFKYRQFGLNYAMFGGHRYTVAVIGFLATWWMGIFIGTGLGLTSLIFKNHQQMAAALLKATLLILLIAFLSGLAGFLYGTFYLSNEGVDWWLPEDLADKKNFITVGSIHNAGYVGGIAGLFAGIVYLIRKNKKLRINHHPK